jgi:16S rRNA C1402 N4-methylase RsmH
MSETDETNVNPAFVKGFNSGYLLQKHEPVLLDEVIKGLEPSELPFVDGLKSGSTEYKKELFKERLAGTSEKYKSQDRDDDAQIGHEKSKK